MLTTANANDRHAPLSMLAPEQIDQLVAYLQQIDAGAPLPVLPFEETPVAGLAPPAGQGTAAAPGTASRASSPGCTVAHRPQSQHFFAIACVLLGLTLARRAAAANTNAA